MSTRTRRVSRLGRYAAGVLLAVGLLVLAVPAISGVAWSGVSAVLVTVSRGGLLLLVLLWLLGLLAHTITLTAALPTLTHRRALTLSLTGSAVANVLPLGGAAGVALNYRMLRDWGFDRPQFATYTVVTNVWDVLAKLVLPVLVLPVLLLTTSLAVPHLGAMVGGAGAVLLVAAGVTAAVMASERVARGVGAAFDRALAPVLRLVRSPHRPALGERFVETQRSCRQVVVHHWGRLTLGMALYTALLFALLASCLSLTGVGLPVAALLAGFVVERLLTLAGITPGGAGVVEVGLTGVLVALGGSAVAVVPGVLLYRALTFALEIPVGGTALAGWWVLRHRARRLVAASAPAGPPDTSVELARVA